MQFADDTAIITPAHASNLRIISETLSVFGRVSGLQVNWDKSGFVPIAVKREHVGTIAAILKCQELTLPTKYLGLPLTIRKPTRSAYLPLITGVQNRFQGWAGSQLSMAGRAVLTNSVLNAMPMHYMQAFLLPVWVTDTLRKISRRFLWRGARQSFSGGHCLVPWGRVVLPKENGGLGIIDLQIQNQSLLMKWLWVASTDEGTLWSATLVEVGVDLARLINEGTGGDAVSFFIRDLLSLTEIFKVSTAAGLDATTDRSWRWTNDGTFTVKSAYLFLSNPGVPMSIFQPIWPMKVPPRVKYFIWLLLHNRLQTADNLLRKGWPTAESCTMCTQGAVETADHLFSTCTRAREVHLRMIPGLTQETVHEAWARVGPLGKRIEWVASVWSIWKERNGRIFHQSCRTTTALLHDIASTVQLWKNKMV